MKLFFNGTHIKFSDSSALENFFHEIENVEDIELWLSAGDKQSLCALINKSCGWLMVLRYPGDVGFSFVLRTNPRLMGKNFRLNCQTDKWITIRHNGQWIGRLFSRLHRNSPSVENAQNLLIGRMIVRKPEGWFVRILAIKTLPPFTPPATSAIVFP